MTPTTLPTEQDYVRTYGEDFMDVIAVFQDLNDEIRGMAGYVCVFAGHRSPWRTSMTLAAFAAEHFGAGRLRRISDGPEGEARYVVLRNAPPIIDRQTTIRPVKAGKAPVFPAWCYFVG